MTMDDFFRELIGSDWEELTESEEERKEFLKSRLRRERSERDRIYSALLGGARPGDLESQK